jgi:hypothetical protein
MGRFKASLTEFVDTIASLKHISENLSDVDALAIMAADGPRKVLQMLHAHSNAVKRYLEILLKLRHPGMRERHWMQFFALFEVRIDSRTLSLAEARRPKPGVETWCTLAPRDKLGPAATTDSVAGLRGLLTLPAFLCPRPSFLTLTLSQAAVVPDRILCRAGV